jgi:phytoene dehydrogenase-like protein
VDVLRANGGELRTRVRVDRILVEDGRVRGVRLTTGEEVYAPSVISNADLKRTYLELLGEEYIKPQTAARIKQLKMALPSSASTWASISTFAAACPTPTTSTAPATTSRVCTRTALKGACPAS